MIASSIVAQERLRTLWLAHRMELIAQARSRLSSSGVRCGVCCAKYEALHPDHIDREAPCQVGSVQTIYRRGLPPNIDLIVFDEAHRSMADTYQAIAASAPNAKILGLTATPCRKDGRGLGDFYRTMQLVAAPSALYAEGYLREPVTYVEDEHQITEGLRGATIAAGDFTAESLRKAVDKPELIGNVVRQALRIAPGVPKIVFAATVAHSRRIAERFLAVGVKAAHLDADTSVEERARVIEALTNGEIEVVTNVDLFFEGWDLPALGAVSLARPTRSFGRLVQMIGRVQRPGGSDRKIVLDHGANCTRLQHFPGEDVTWALTQGAPRNEGPEERVKVCFACHLVIGWKCAECPQCGTAQPSTRSRREILQEDEANLIELQRSRLEQRRAALRIRAEKIAQTRGLNAAWIDRVVDGELPLKES